MNKTTATTAFPAPLKRGVIKVYFPEFPDHELNGSSFSACGASIDTFKGLITRDNLVVWEASENNLNRSSGYWWETFKITPDMFGPVDKVLVKIWFLGHEDRFFYLTR